MSHQAQAADGSVDTSVVGQSYVASSPYGSPVVRRRRLTQTLGFGTGNVFGATTSYGPELAVTARLRLDTDFGQTPEERDPTSLDTYIPGLEEAPLDLMYAYVDTRGHLGGWLGGRLGRQYVTDVLGWWSFDGARLTISTPAYFQVEGYAGFEQRGGLPTLSTARFSGDGVYRGSRRDLTRDQWPDYLEESRLAPAYGVAIETLDLSAVQARLSYRKVVNRDAVLIAPLLGANEAVETYRDSRVSTEKVGGTVWLADEDLGNIAAFAVQDLLTGRWSEHGTSASWFANSDVTLQMEYDYFRPSFDGDSIFNWFSHRGMTTYRLRSTWQYDRRLALSASSGLRQFRANRAEEPSTSPPAAGISPRSTTGEGAVHDMDALASLEARYRFAAGDVLATASGEAGSTGHHLGGDVATRKTYVGGLYDTLLVLSVHDFHDDLREQRSATSLGYVVGVGLNPFHRTRIGVEWEHDHNRLVGHRLRALATLAVEVTP